MNLSDVGKIALVGAVTWFVGKQIFGAETDRKSAETTQMATATGYQPPAYPEMVVESLTMRPEVNAYLNTEYGSAPLPSPTNLVAMIRGTPL